MRLGTPSRSSSRPRNSAAIPAHQAHGSESRGGWAVAARKAARALSKCSLMGPRDSPSGPVAATALPRSLRASNARAMKKTTGQDRSITRNWRPATQAIRGGTMRSDQGETSEALYLTSGFTYDDAATVAARFAGEQEGMTYSRLQNPTVAMLEERIALLEGAEACRAQASGMAAMTAALLCQLSAGDHIVAGKAAFGSCRWLVDSLLPRFGVETTVIDGTVNAE